MFDPNAVAKEVLKTLSTFGLIGLLAKRKEVYDLIYNASRAEFERHVDSAKSHETT